MTKTVDLNADMGESFGPWPMGQDAALLKIVSSANIACGFHAGDPDTMARTMDFALAAGVALGAHPGFADLQGFGRRRIKLSAAELTHLVQYQLGAAMGMAAARGARLAHFKLHEASFAGYVLACTAVTFALAGLSWHLVEKQALRWK